MSEQDATGNGGAPQPEQAQPGVEPELEGEAQSGGEAAEPEAPEATASEVEQAEATSAEAEPTGPDAEIARLTTQLAERTADLQRLQAEFVNYKRRVERDREAVREAATVNVVTTLLPVLDDIDRARDHGELEGGFKAVAESLERTVAGLGLERFGKPGEEFDPRVHEALSHDYADDVDTVTAQTIMQVGYRLGERILRPARVAVVEPAPIDAPVTPEQGEPAEEANEE